MTPIGPHPLLMQDHSTSTSVVVKLPYLHHSAVVPDDVTKREVTFFSLPSSKSQSPCSSQKTVTYFATRCQQIIELAIKWTPDETKSILEVSFINGYNILSMKAKLQMLPPPPPPPGLHLSDRVCQQWFGSPQCHLTSCHSHQ